MITLRLLPPVLNPQQDLHSSFTLRGRRRSEPALPSLPLISGLCFQLFVRRRHRRRRRLLLQEFRRRTLLERVTN